MRSVTTDLWYILVMVKRYNAKKNYGNRPWRPIGL
jgi:hypothetical protein